MGENLPVSIFFGGTVRFSQRLRGLGIIYVAINKSWPQSPAYFDNFFGPNSFRRSLELSLKPPEQPRLVSVLRTSGARDPIRLLACHRHRRAYLLMLLSAALDNAAPSRTLLPLLTLAMLVLRALALLLQTPPPPALELRW